MNFLLKKFILFYEIIYDTTKGFIEDDALTHAAAISYFIMLSIIPIIVLAVSIFSYIIGNTQEAYNWILSQINNFYPDVIYKYTSYLKKIIEEVINIRGTALGLGIVSLLWIGMNTFGALENSINVVMKITTPRNYFQRKLISLILLILLGIMLYGTTLFSAIINFVLNSKIILLNFDVFNFWNLFNHYFPFVVYFLSFFIIYELLPRNQMPLKAIIIGSISAAIFWSLAKYCFSWFVINISQYSKLYGSLASIVIFIVWLYFSVIIMVYFGEMIYAIKIRQK